MEGEDGQRTEEAPAETGSGAGAGGEERGEVAESPRWPHDDSLEGECGVGSRGVGRRTVRRARGAGGVLLGRVLREEERAGCKEAGASFTWIRGHAPLERRLPPGYVCIISSNSPPCYKKTEADGTVSISSDPPVREVRGRLLCYVIYICVCIFDLYPSDAFMPVHRYHYCLYIHIYVHLCTDTHTHTHVHAHIQELPTRVFKAHLFQHQFAVGAARELSLTYRVCVRVCLCIQIYMHVCKLT